MSQLNSKVALPNHEISRIFTFSSSSFRKFAGSSTISVAATVSSPSTSVVSPSEIPKSYFPSTEYVKTSSSSCPAESSTDIFTSKYPNSSSSNSSGTCPARRLIVQFTISNSIQSGSSSWFSIVISNSSSLSISLTSGKSYLLYLEPSVNT